jgi:SDR family mycofactocin-dependent oxidoreductase
MTGRVAGKVALITGAARGQGRAHALRLAEEGADIIAIDICAGFDTISSPPATPQDLAETVELVEALDRRVVSRIVDTRNFDALKVAVDDGVGALGHLDIVVANAGISTMARWSDVTPALWNEMIAVNLTGTWNTVMAGAPHLVSAGGGSIILTSSVAGLKGLPFLVPYVASKHGVVGLMRAFAAELAKDKIRVNTLHPTGVDTPMNHGDGFSVMEVAGTENPRIMGMYTNMIDVQMTEAIDQAHAVLFLASDESRYVTSMTMTVDAGNASY